MKFLITGATGLIGKQVGKAVAAKGHEIVVITRNRRQAEEHLPFPCQIIEGDLNNGPLKGVAELKGVEGVINLMGENVGHRWTENRKRRIYESRVLGTRYLIESLVDSPRIFVSASAIGYYGARGDEELTEESPAGDDFLAQVCQDWEEELLTFSYTESPGGTRVIALRTGMVLARHNGALESLVPLFSHGWGGTLGSGRQWMSWVHIDDAVGLIMHALENSTVQGPLNVTAPHPVTNQEFTATLAEVLHKTTGPRVPKVALRLSLGEMSRAVLSSQRVLPQKALQTGYKFRFENLRDALADLLDHETRGEDCVESEQYLPWPPEKVFPFFSDAKNLEQVSPEDLRLHVVKVSTETMRKDTEIDYHVRFHGIPTSLKTQIQEWDPPYRFVDVQLDGPYSLWHHTHEFVPFAKGTLLKDKVRYRLPLGDVGRLVAGGFMRREVEKMLAYRKESIAKNLATHS